jgi:hypothetical protein
VELFDLTFASGVRGWVGNECQIRSTRTSAEAASRSSPAMRWTIAVALLIGFVLAMALVFGGSILGIDP